MIAGVTNLSLVSPGISNALNNSSVGVDRIDGAAPVVQRPEVLPNAKKVPKRGVVQMVSQEK